jgi:hypothetical protein
MSAISHLLELARVYGEAEKIGPSTVSWRVFGDTKKLGAIQSGADIQVRRLEKALHWFSDHWPEGAEWPEDVPRPDPEPQAPPPSPGSLGAAAAEVA